MYRISLSFINDSKIKREVTKAATFLDEIKTTLPPELPDDSDGFILIPLIVLFGTLMLAALVYLMARNRYKRKHAKLKNYNRSNDNDTAILCDDELDDTTECLLNGKLEIEGRYNTYKTMNLTMS